jgi:hypothetical protein
MSDQLQIALTLLVYAVVGAAAVIGAKYGLLDSGVSDIIIGGVLTHMGLNYSPLQATVKTGTPTS